MCALLRPTEGAELRDGPAHVVFTHPRPRRGYHPMVEPAVPAAIRAAVHVEGETEVVVKCQSRHSSSSSFLASDHRESHEIGAEVLPTPGAGVGVLAQKGRILLNLLEREPHGREPVEDIA